ncbi:MAG: hypothetical protein ACTSQI_11580 [Candidatus Helarchaeota archaeon]
MPSRRKLVCLGLFALSFLMILIISYPSNASTSHSPPYLTGDYNGNMSICYFIEWMDGGSITLGDRFSNALDPNRTNSQGYLFTVNSLEIRANNILNGTGVKIIADNTSVQSNITSAMKVAQEFKIDQLCTIQQFSVFMNYSIHASFNNPTIFKFTIVEADMTTTIIETEYPFYSPETGSRWFNFWLNPNIIQANTSYFIVFESLSSITATGLGGGNEGPGGSMSFRNQNSSWIAQFHNSSIYNAGLTLKYNGSTWLSVSNDTIRDMLCYLNYDIVIDPESLGLQLLINNETRAWERQLPEWGSGYEVFYLHYFSDIFDTPINITITVNQTIPTMQINEDILYIYQTAIFGSYNASNTKVDWTITYPARTVRDIMWPTGQMFAFEADWDYVEFLNPTNSSVSSVYFGPITVYNQSFYAALLEFPFGWVEPGDYTGIFRSPNYCHSFYTKVKGDSGFEMASQFELGQTVQIDVPISDSLGNPISGGNATINFTSPTGETLSFVNLTSSIGIVTTGEFLIDENFETGPYTITVFWTNGREVGFYSYTINVISPPSMLIWYIVIGAAVALAAATFPMISYTRKRLQTRNWEKYLHNLFILSKDGRSIYGYSFGIEIQDPALVSAALMAISSFVSDAVKSKKGLRVIDLEDKKVILGHGTHFTTALIAEKDFPIIRARTEQFTQAFEKHYGGKVASWTGDSSVFKGTDKLIQEYFPVTMEERITRGVKLKLMETHERLESAEEPEVLIGIMREITQLLQRYREIIEEHYMDEYTKLMTMFDKKIANTT